MFKKFATPALAAAVALAPAARTDAGDAGKIILGIGVGAAIGCATGALNCGGNRKATKQRSYQPSVSSAQREQNRQVQTALNTFGFPVGAADGVIGRGTRAGISNYQSYMGYPATGQLTDLERNLLLNGLNQFNAGQGGQYAAAMQRDGTKGMLKGLRGDPGYAPQFNNTAQNNGGFVNPGGGYTNPNGYTGQQALQQPNAGQVVTPAPQPQVVQPAPVTTPTTLPTLKPGLQAASASMADRCELVELLGATNGVIQVGNITDPDRALSEQFCGMRTYAMGEGAQVLNSYGIDTAGAITQVCGPVAQAMEADFPSLAEGDPEAMSAKAAQTIAGMGVSDPALIRDYGKMCVSAGYDTDDPEIALSGALMMLSIGDYAYAETAAHHLREGFGVKQDVPAAVKYYQAALSTYDQGAQPAFLPEQARNRAEVIRGSISHNSIQAALGNSVTVVPVNAPAVLPLLQKN